MMLFNLNRIMNKIYTGKQLRPDRDQSRQKRIYGQCCPFFHEMSSNMPASSYWNI